MYVLFDIHFKALIKFMIIQRQHFHSLFNKIYIELMVVGDEFILSVTQVIKIKDLLIFYRIILKLSISLLSVNCHVVQTLIFS